MLFAAQLLVSFCKIANSIDFSAETDYPLCTLLPFSSARPEFGGYCSTLYINLSLFLNPID